MDEPRTVPAASTGEAQSRTEDQPACVADQVDLSKSIETVGVDLPGVGHVLPGAPYLVGAMSDALRQMVEQGDEEQRDQLLCELLFAARQLAERSVLPVSADLAWLPNAETRTPGSTCRECHATVFGVGRPLQHAKHCRTARVLRVLADLEQLTISRDKEGAQDGEQDAGDGIRPRGLKERVCLRCGARDSAWLSELRAGVVVDLSNLGINQCVETAANGVDHVLHTHLCIDVASEGGAA